MISYTNSDITDSVFSDENIIASRVHLGIIGAPDSPFQKSGVFVWIEGEIYNFNEILELFNFKSRHFEELLIDAYHNNKLDIVLSKIDGCFSAVLYDKAVIKLISDRFGMKPLYYWGKKNNFTWVSEIKALLAFEYYKPEIDPKVVKCFMDLGHLLGENTWFKYVKLINASTILTYSLKLKKIVENKRYWKWSYIKLQEINFKDAVIILSNLLGKAIQKRIEVGEKLCIPLSGGLDSRLVLAEINKNVKLKVPCFTFGKKKCADIKIASTVTSIKSNTHFIFELNEKNWFENRFHYTWRTDGMISLLHIHNSKYDKVIKEKCDIIIEGFSGDLCIGGSYIDDLDTPITKEAAYRKFRGHYRFTNLKDSFYNVLHQDAYFIDTRVRRFTNMGAFGYSRIVEIRRPLIDNDLIDFLYSISDDYRYKSKLYNKTLLYKYPEYYESIPWQKTGYPISKRETIFGRFKNLIKHLLDVFEIIQTKKKYTDYANWLRSLKMIKIIMRLLDPKNAIYSHYTNENYLTKYFIPHNQNPNLIRKFLDLIKLILYIAKEVSLNKGGISPSYFKDILEKYFLYHRYDYSEEIGRALTMEIWFQQVFNKKYRDINPIL